MAEEQLVTFSLGKEEFGVDIMRVQEIVLIPPITRVPKAPPYVEGAINLRGNVITVIDLKKRFGLAPDPGDAPDADLARIVIIRTDQDEIGVRVDQVTEVLMLDERFIEPSPSVTIGIDTSFVRGVGKVGERLVILLDIDKVIMLPKEEGEGFE